MNKLFVLIFISLVVSNCESDSSARNADQTQLALRLLEDSQSNAATSEYPLNLSINGQGNTLTEEQKTEMRNKLATELSLTEEQKTKLFPILDEQKAFLESLKSNTSLTRDQKRAQAEAKRAEFKTRIEAVLTADQMKKMEEIHQAHRRNHGPGPGRGPRPF
jgi:Spy/CpxP family protein refolding chaperone